MLYLPNNRLRPYGQLPADGRGTNTPNYEQPTLTGSEPELSWKGQCWWLERNLHPIVDFQFVGTDEFSTTGVGQLCYVYPLFNTSPYVLDGYFLGLYKQENGEDFISKNSYSNQQITRIVSDKPYIIVNHPDMDSNNADATIYGTTGFIYNRVLLCLAVYIPVGAIDAGKHTFVRIKSYGNFGENYLVNNPYDGKYDFYLIHECDENGETKQTVSPNTVINNGEDYVKWPLYPKEVLNNLPTPERKTLGEIFDTNTNNAPRLDDYITSSYYKVEAGETIYIYVLLDAKPLNLDFYASNKCGLNFWDGISSFAGNGIYYPVYDRGTVRYGSYINNLYTDNYDITYDVLFDYKIKVEELNSAPEGDNNFQCSNITRYYPDGYFSKKIKFHFDNITRTTENNVTKELYIGPIRKKEPDPDTGFDSAYKKYNTMDSPLWAGTCYQRRGVVNLIDDTVQSSSDIDDGSVVGDYKGNIINSGVR